MPIQISYEPAAGVVAGAAQLGGLGDYSRWLNQFRNSQYQFGVDASLKQQQINNDRLQAFQQAALQQQQQASSQQFEAQMLPYRSALDAQNQAFQSNLAEGVAQRAATRHFQDQSALSQQNADQQAAQLAQQQQGQLFNAQAMATFSEDQQVAQQFQSDPFQTMKQNQQQAQQAGYDYSPDQQQRMQRAKSNLTAMQTSLQNGSATLPTLLPAIKQEMYTLRSISANPEVQPPPSLQDQFSKDVLWANPQDPQQPFANAPQPGHIPVQKNQKTGQWEVLRSWPKPGDMGGATGEDGGIISDKRIGLQFKNAVQGEDWVSRSLDRWTKAHQAQSFVDPQGYQDAYTQEEARLRSIVQQFSPQAPMAGNRKAPMQMPPQQPGMAGQPPAPGITPQNPQGAPQNGAPPNIPQGYQTPARNTPQQAPQQVQRPPGIVPHIHPQQIPQFEHQLSQKPRSQWTLQDFELQAAIYQAKGIKLPTREEVMGGHNGHANGQQRRAIILPPQKMEGGLQLTHPVIQGPIAPVRLAPEPFRYDPNAPMVQQQL